MTVYKLFVTESASAAVASASIDIQNDGTITCVTLGASCTEGGSAGVNAAINAELTFSSTPQFTSNDIRASLCQVALNLLAFTTTPGVGLPSVPFCVIPALEVTVAAGERIFIHLQASVATIDTASAVAYIYVNDGQSSRPDRRRR